MICLLIGATLTVFVRDSWPLYLFCIAVMLMLAVIAAKRQLDRVSLLPLLIPAFGLVQLLLSTTAYAPATRVAALRWFALAGVMMITQASFARDRQRRDRFLDQFVLFAALTAILCLLQMHSSQGKVLWFFNTGYDDVVYAFFPSRNNYGQFVELALGVALCRAMTDKTRGLWFGLASALLYASAIASTSRGAAVLTTIELLVVPAVTLWRSRKSQILHAGLLYAGVFALALIWTAVSGWDATWKRFGEPDAYQGRREFTQSALQMAKDRPLIGQGLGTFSLVYPKYAKIDSPELVNFAHDDWAEFAADGGFLFAALVLGLFAWALPRLPRHPWSLGLVFVLVHALFDFPFQRVAIAGWMFALLGSLPAASGVRVKVRGGWLARAAVGVCCAVGVYWSARLGVADAIYRRDTLAAVRRAAEIVPDESRYYVRLAQLYDGNNVRPILERALQLNPWNSNTLIQLGLDAELRGDLAGAEASFLKAAQLDLGWLPRWTLANYYFRRGDATAFWTWAGKATSNASDRRDFIPLFRLASQLEPDPAEMLDILPERAVPLRHYVTYLLETGETRSLEKAAMRLADCGSIGNDRPYVFWAIEGFLAHKQPDGAVHLWSKLKQRRWIREETGATFADPPLESSLDWRYTEVNGVTRTHGGDGRLRLQFSGQQPEEMGLVERFAPVRPKVKQRVEWGRATSPSEAGVRWQIQALNGAVLASSELASGGVEFTPEESIVRVRLVYRRPPGTTRMSGVVDLAPARVVSFEEQAGDQSRCDGCAVRVSGPVAGRDFGRR